MQNTASRYRLHFYSSVSTNLGGVTKSTGKKPRTMFMLVRECRFSFSAVKAAPPVKANGRRS